MNLTSAVSISIRRDQRSAPSSQAIHRLLDPALKGIEDQTGYQPTKRDMPLLSNFTEVAKKIVGQDNGDFRIGFQDSRSLVMDWAG